MLRPGGGLLGLFWVGWDGQCFRLVESAVVLTVWVYTGLGECLKIVGVNFRVL